ncbi:MAG: hypothetical protein JSV05_00980 [Candidatus Bathyarchaeota archaeon]|nr:MAG: hypothetical protein JSV05_00980 [Candidatus Bathyarchaeota archaeon]
MLDSQTHEKRRKKALDDLVKKYLESKKREEALRRKLESYGFIRRWIYKRRAGLKQTFRFLKEAVVKPFFVIAFAFSGWITAMLATSVMPIVGPIIEVSVPLPFNYVLVFLLATCIVFSPFIISLEIYRYFQVKREKKMLREEYGIEI